MLDQEQSLLRLETNQSQNLHDMLPFESLPFIKDDAHSDDNDDYLDRVFDQFVYATAKEHDFF